LISLGHLLVLSGAVHVPKGRELRPWAKVALWILDRLVVSAVVIAVMVFALGIASMGVK
jgi:hypothetical protein